MKKWLKYGLWFGIIAAILSLILNGFGAWSEGNIIGSLIFLPILPMMFILGSLVDLVEGSSGASFFAAIIASILVFIGYFIWGAIIGRITDIESGKKKIFVIILIIVIAIILIFGFLITIRLLMLRSVSQGIQPIEFILPMIG